MNTFFRIIGCGDLQQVATQKAEGGLLSKRAVVLQELGGRMADQYVVTLLGESAARPLAPGDLVEPGEGGREDNGSRRWSEDGTEAETGSGRGNGNRKL